VCQKDDKSQKKLKIFFFFFFYKRNQNDNKKEASRKEVKETDLCTKDFFFPLGRNHRRQPAPGEVHERYCMYGGLTIEPLVSPSPHPKKPFAGAPGGGVKWRSDFS
jgi:hypothetical protein